MDLARLMYIKFHYFDVRRNNLMLFLQLLLQDGGLHADVNGDGVLDHVQV